MQQLQPQLAILSKRLRAVLGGLVLVFVCVGSVWMAVAASKRREAKPLGLVVRAEYLDLGDVWEQDDFRWELPIENANNYDVDIRDFSTTCSCLSVEPRSLTIPAGGSASIKLKLDLSPRSPEALQQTSGRVVTVSIAGQTATNPKAFEWTLSGRVRRAMNFAPPLLDFEDELVRSLPYKATTVQVTCNTPISRLVVTADESVVRVATRAGSTPSTFVIEVTPRDTLREGHFETDVVVKPIPTKGEALPSRKLRVVGTVRSALRPTPEAVLLGVRDVGDRVSETVSVRSSTTTPGVVEVVAPTPKGVTVESVGKDERGNYRFRLTVQIAKEGEQRISVDLAARGESGEVGRVSLPVSYFGIRGMSGKP